MRARKDVVSRYALCALLLLAGAGPAAGKPPAPAVPKVQKTVVHWLPFPAGVAYGCFQGNDQPPSHNDVWNRYAFDFSPMAVGSDVCATASGVVTFVKEDTEGPTKDLSDNNEVAVLYEDGSVGTYLHLMKDGALVEVDQRVYAGDVIGKSGNTGKSGGPHLHFGLREGTRLGRSIPCRFQEVAGDGVPKTGDVVTSKNVRGSVLQGAFDRVDAQYELAAKIDARTALIPRLQPLLRGPIPAEYGAILSAYANRPDMKTIYSERRDAVLERWRTDAKSALDAVAAAKDAGDVAGATALAARGRADYAPLEVAAKFQEALTAMKADPAYGKAAQSVAAPLEWARELGRAFDAEAKAREKAASEKPAGWPAVLDAYAAALGHAPTEAARTALGEYVDALRAQVGTAR